MVLGEDTPMLVSDDCNVAWATVVSSSAGVVVGIEKAELSFVEINEIKSLVELEDMLSNAGSMLPLVGRLTPVGVVLELVGSGLEVESTEETEMIEEELRSLIIEPKLSDEVDEETSARLLDPSCTSLDVLESARTVGKLEVIDSETSLSPDELLEEVEAEME
ncbi:hypothetical protein SGCOL_008628 [Colletotrichum sp. CLE4]